MFIEAVQEYVVVVLGATIIEAVFCPPGDQEYITELATLDPCNIAVNVTELPIQMELFEEIVRESAHCASDF